jgi:hypothetical protein
VGLLNVFGGYMSKKKKKDNTNDSSVIIKEPKKDVILTVPKEEVTARTVCKDGYCHISIK